jgi:hypothetical protein
MKDGDLHRHGKHKLGFCGRWGLGEEITVETEDGNLVEG